MAAGQLSLTYALTTITIGGANAKWLNDEFPRQQINPRALEFNPSGTSIVVGAAYLKYQWAVSALFLPSELNKLWVIWDACDAAARAGNSPAITIVDETEFFVTGANLSTTCYIPERPRAANPGNWIGVTFTAIQL